ncbi:restriction endonuclease [Xanthomonas maliensis]|uniref:restriction endonuclease n=1 Tax=Xanthomonas maliensis TaxID=1321368 RepID=UPI0003AAB417|nr:restriction endonuclease [Xanthomonas maliensis]KAB7769306.1 hypothetical protein CKY51_06875 [Xanthomonas maliensis]
MHPWILALLAALLLWLGLCAYFWLVYRRSDETNRGIRALATMHWRDFGAVVVRVLQEQRGWQPLKMPQDGIPSTDFMMQTEHGTRLVACKHGRGYRIGVAAVNELGASARLAGAVGGVMVTEGRMEGEGLAAADKQSVEVLDGVRLWPLLKPYLPGDVESSVVQGARRRAIRYCLLTGMAIAAGGVAIGLALRPATPTVAPAIANSAAPAAAPARTPPAAAAPPTTAASPATSSPAPAAVPAPVPATSPGAASTPAVSSAATPPTAPSTSPANGEPDAQTMAGYRRELSKILAQTPGLVRGIWVTPTTLAVDRTVEDAQAWPLICKEVQQYPYLRTVRVQLNPRPGNKEAVRWRQCATF